MKISKFTQTKALPADPQTDKALTIMSLNSTRIRGIPISLLHKVEIKPQDLPSLTKPLHTQSEKFTENKCVPSDYKRDPQAVRVKQGECSV